MLSMSSTRSSPAAIAKFQGDEAHRALVVELGQTYGEA
jgi:hypothetical protein